MDNAQKFSTLIIGCGAIAGGYDEKDITGPNILTHAKAFQHHPGFDLVGCLDLNEKVAQTFADTWNVPHVYSSLEQAMEDRSYDLISLCSSTPSHYSYLRFLNQQDMRLVFCEKPLTDRLDTAQDIAGLYPDRMAVNYLRRFDPAIRRLAQDITAGKYGTLVFGQAKYNKGLFNNGSHMTDLLEMMFGPLNVIGASDVTYDFWPEDPTISAQIETQQNVQIDLIGSDVRDGMVFDLTLQCEHAEIIFTDFSHSLLINPKDGPSQKVETDLDRGMLNVVSHLYDHLTKGDELWSTADNALAALALCDAIRRKAGL